MNIISPIWLNAADLIKRKNDAFLISSYEPGNRAVSVTGMNFVVCSDGKFQPGRPR